MMQEPSGMVRCGISLALIVAQLVPVPVLASNSSSSLRSVSLNKTGSWEASHEAVYPDLIRRVQKWVENIDSLGVQVQLSSKVVNKNNLGLDKLRLNLSESTERLRKELLSGAEKQSLSALLSDMRDFRRKASGASDLGPEIQSSLVTEAAYHWSIGDLSSARTALERAIRIQPKGQVSTLVDWDEPSSSAFSLDSFEGFLSKVQADQVRNCSVLIKTNVSPVLTKINGFSIGDTKEFTLVPGNIHHLEIQSPGFEVKKEQILCSGPGKKLINVVLKKSKEPHSIAFNELDRTARRGSMILIEPVGDRFKLFLYTPGRDFDEIPLRHPLKIADLDSDVNPLTGPIATDATIAIFEKHKLLASSLTPDSVGAGLERALTQDVDKQIHKKSWYESPVFWGIVGGIALGGAITYFANRKNNTVSSDWE